MNLQEVTNRIHFCENELKKIQKQKYDLEMASNAYKEELWRLTGMYDEMVDENEYKRF